MSRYTIKRELEEGEIEVISVYSGSEISENEDDLRLVGIKYHGQKYQTASTMYSLSGKVKRETSGDSSASSETVRSKEPKVKKEEEEEEEKKVKLEIEEEKEFLPRRRSARGPSPQPQPQPMASTSGPPPNKKRKARHPPATANAVPSASHKEVPREPEAEPARAYKILSMKCSCGAANARKCKHNSCGVCCPGPCVRHKLKKKIDLYSVKKEELE